jgi:hypothetical protein
MMSVPVLLSGLLLHPVADTVWWRTTIGNVVEHRAQRQATCTLTLDNDKGRFSFIWDRSLPTRVIVQRNDWTFPSTMTTVAMEINSATSASGNDASGIPALTRASAIMFVADQSVTGQLATADRISVRTPDARFDMPLIPAKMSALMAAVHKCRDAISR